jgi:hypothetical protein
VRFPEGFPALSGCCSRSPSGPFLPLASPSRAVLRCISPGQPVSPSCGHHTAAAWARVAACRRPASPREQGLARRPAIGRWGGTEHQWVLGRSRCRMPSGARGRSPCPSQRCPEDHGSQAPYLLPIFSLSSAYHGSHACRTAATSPPLPSMALLAAPAPSGRFPEASQRFSRQVHADCGRVCRNCTVRGLLLPALAASSGDTELWAPFRPACPSRAVSPAPCRSSVPP